MYETTPVLHDISDQFKDRGERIQGYDSTRDLGCLFVMCLCVCVCNDS